MTEREFWKALDQRLANVEQKAVRRDDAMQTYTRISQSDPAHASKSVMVLRQASSHLAAARVEINDFVRDALISSARGLLIIEQQLPSRLAPGSEPVSSGGGLSGEREPRSTEKL